MQRYLGHNSPRVRLSAAGALARGGSPEAPLLRAVHKERNELVLASLCEALGDVGGDASLPTLRSIAEEHRSQLVRRQALAAIAVILDDEAVDYLRARRASDNSRRVRATIDVLLLWLGGDGDVVARLESHLGSRDRIVRSIVVVMPRYYTELRRSKPLRQLLDRAANKDRDRALRSDALATLKALTT